MRFLPEDIESNRRWFEMRLKAVRQKRDLLTRIEAEASGAAAPGSPPGQVGLDLTRVVEDLDFMLVDVRSRAAFAAGHIRGAHCLPYEEIDEQVGKLPLDREIVAYCWNETCLLAARAGLKLTARGFFVRELNTGWREWIAESNPVHAAGVEGMACGCSR